MTDSNITEVCLDQPLPLGWELKAQQIAMAENPHNAPKSSSRLEMALDWHYLWKPGSMLKVRFLNGAPQLHTKVIKYAQEWEQFAQIVVLQ